MIFIQMYFRVKLKSSCWSLLSLSLPSSISSTHNLEFTKLLPHSSLHLSTSSHWPKYEYIILDLACRGWGILWSAPFFLNQNIQIHFPHPCQPQICFSYCFLSLTLCGSKLHTNIAYKKQLFNATTFHWFWMNSMLIFKPQSEIGWCFRSCRQVTFSVLRSGIILWAPRRRSRAGNSPSQVARHQRHRHRVQPLRRPWQDVRDHETRAPHRRRLRCQGGQGRVGGYGGGGGQGWRAAVLSCHCLQGGLGLLFHLHLHLDLPVAGVLPLLGRHGGADYGRSLDRHHFSERTALLTMVRRSGATHGARKWRRGARRSMGGRLVLGGARFERGEKIDAERERGHLGGTCSASHRHRSVRQRQPTQ